MRKWAGTRRERTRAKKVLKALKTLRLSTTPVEMRPSVEIMALDEEAPDNLFVRHRLRPRVNDDRLLASVLAFGEAQSGAAILVLTADMGLSLKAPTRKIAVFVPDERLQRKDEPDEREREIETLRRQIAALQTVQPDVSLTLEGKKFLKREVRIFGEFSVGKLGSILAEWRTKNPYFGARSDSILMPDRHRIPLASFIGIPGLLSTEEAKKRNDRIDRFYGEYREFLQRWPAQLNAIERCIKFQFVLENVGTSPAEDVDVLISAHANGKWIEKIPELPKAPAMPKPRNPFDFGIIPPQMHPDLPSLLLRDESMDGPNLLEDEPHCVRYSVTRVKHHMPYDLPVVYFQFASDQDVRSFTLTYCLVAANIREPKRNDLHVKLGVSTATEPPSPAELASIGEEEDDSARDV